MKIKEAMKLAKETGKPQKVTEKSEIGKTTVRVVISLDLELLDKCKALAAERQRDFKEFIVDMLDDKIRDLR